MEQTETMIARRLVLTAGLAVILSITGLDASARADDGGDKARIFIESLAERAISTLAVTDIDRDQREERFRSLLAEHFDVRFIGRWVLGHYWKKATAAEQDEYLQLFEDLIVVIYANRFSEYKGETLSVLKTVAGGKRDIIVRTEIIQPDGSRAARLDWRVRPHEGGLKIVDIMVEGISMGLTQRKEFASVIRKNGGHVEALLVELRKLLKKDA